MEVDKDKAPLETDGVDDHELHAPLPGGMLWTEDLLGRVQLVHMRYAEHVLQVDPTGWWHHKLWRAWNDDRSSEWAHLGVFQDGGPGPLIADGVILPKGAEGLRQFGRASMLMAASLPTSGGAVWPEVDLEDARWGWSSQETQAGQAYDVLAVDRRRFHAHLEDRRARLLAQGVAASYVSQMETPWDWARMRSVLERFDIKLPVGTLRRCALVPSQGGPDGVLTQGWFRARVRSRDGGQEEVRVWARVPTEAEWREGSSELQGLLAATSGLCRERHRGCGGFPQEDGRFNVHPNGWWGEGPAWAAPRGWTEAYCSREGAMYHVLEGLYARRGWSLARRAGRVAALEGREVAQEDNPMEWVLGVSGETPVPTGPLSYSEGMVASWADLPVVRLEPLVPSNTRTGRSCLPVWDPDAEGRDSTTSMLLLPNWERAEGAASRLILVPWTETARACYPIHALPLPVQSVLSRVRTPRQGLKDSTGEDVPIHNVDLSKSARILSWDDAMSLREGSCSEALEASAAMVASIVLSESGLLRYDLEEHPDPVDQIGHRNVGSAWGKLGDRERCQLMLRWFYEETGVDLGLGGVWASARNVAAWQDPLPAAPALWSPGDGE